MFERIKRVTPGPQRAFEAGLKPITSIFDEIQGWSGHERELPDCNQFVDELFNINMLTVDVYAPAQKPRRPRAGLRSDRDDPIFALASINNTTSPLLGSRSERSCHHRMRASLLPDLACGAWQTTIAQLRS